MSNYAGPLYETSFVIKDEVVTDVEAWLQQMLESALTQPGIEFARSIESSTDSTGHSVRVCQFQTVDDNALDELTDGFFSSIDAEIAANFSDKVVVRSRVLRVDENIDLLLDESPTCLNCGTRLRGQYCGKCGQRSRNRLISIWQLLREAFGDLLELDSRLWRTLVPLLTRPGQLTRDYLEGRRARYMPPFRTYLVLSVIFFVVAFFDPTKDLSLFFEPEPEPTPEEIAATQASAAAARDAAKEQFEAAREQLEELESSELIPSEIIDEIIDDDDDYQISIGSADGFSSSEGIFEDCDSASIGAEDDAPEWIKRRFTDERMQEICERNKARGNESFADAMLDNVPVALIVLLPLMALVLKLLYPLSRRYFVEHLLFFVHFHAFFFLMLTLQVLFASTVGLFGPEEDGAIDDIKSLIIVIASIYIPVYLYKAMRHVYGQGHIVTIPKYFILTIAYLFGALLTMLSAALAALVSAPGI